MESFVLDLQGAMLFVLIFASWSTWNMRYMCEFVTKDLVRYNFHWFESLALVRLVLTAVFLKVKWGFSFFFSQDRIAIDRGGVFLGSTMFPAVSFVEVVEFWKFSGKLSFFVAFRRDILKIKDDAHWVPPGCLYYLFDSKKQVRVIVRADGSEMRVGDVFPVALMMGYWSTGNQEDKKLLVLFCYAQLSCDWRSFFLEHISLLEIVA
ncbi:uncharacterized protein LOC114745479 [Neltuma alba]|uniref:uncharacterized protein LOC114745479 n=1 Tax=Neltuma alba TaxID=207710 RepID=UPI0010A36809|nr:uncharacterized protein LOC114745479 [Prosopis alba]